MIMTDIAHAVMICVTGTVAAKVLGRVARCVLEVQRGTVRGGIAARSALRIDASVPGGAGHGAAAAMSGGGEIRLAAVAGDAVAVAEAGVASGYAEGRRDAASARHALGRNIRRGRTHVSAGPAV